MGSNFATSHLYPQPSENTPGLHEKPTALVFLRETFCSSCRFRGTLPPLPEISASSTVAPQNGEDRVNTPLEREPLSNFNALQAEITQPRA